MSHPQTQEVLIGTTGCAGLTATIDAARVQLTTTIDAAPVHLEPLIVEGQQPDGQLTAAIDAARGGLTP